MSDRERSITLDEPEAQDPNAPIETYQAKVCCRNCDFKGMVAIPRGRAVGEGVCPNCLCQTLEKPARTKTKRKKTIISGTIGALSPQAPMPLPYVYPETPRPATMPTYDHRYRHDYHVPAVDHTYRSPSTPDMWRSSLDMQRAINHMVSPASPKQIEGLVMSSGPHTSVMQAQTTSHLANMMSYKQ